MRLDGKVALITGGGTGIGAAVAERFVAEGAKVCVTGRRAELLDKMVKSLPADTAVACAGDVSEPDDAQKMVDTTVKFGGKLDILINNAGIEGMGAVVDLPLEEWQKVIDINLTGCFLMMKYAIPHMIKAGGGSVVSMSALSGLRGLPTMPAYSAAKGGLQSLTTQSAIDYGPAKIRCNIVAPGPIRTDIFEEVFGHIAAGLCISNEEAFKRIEDVVPIRAIGTPADVAALCCFLASDDSKFITGATIVIDGGAAMVDPVGKVLGDCVAAIMAGK
ncbi:MAG: glucose 1-dehydrogenase [Actinobacteria bacterium]|nr:glucose 1-dehydrogenase [Actinomycetota bacterium]